MIIQMIFFEFLYFDIIFSKKRPSQIFLKNAFTIMMNALNVDNVWPSCCSYSKIAFISDTNELRT